MLCVTVTLLIKIILILSLATIARDFAVCPIFLCNYLQVFLQCERTLVLLVVDSA